MTKQQKINIEKSKRLDRITRLMYRLNKPDGRGNAMNVTKSKESKRINKS